MHIYVYVYIYIYIYKYTLYISHTKRSCGGVLTYSVKELPLHFRIFGSQPTCLDLPRLA